MTTIDRRSGRSPQRAGTRRQSLWRLIERRNAAWRGRKGQRSWRVHAPWSHHQTSTTCAEGEVGGSSKVRKAGMGGRRGGTTDPQNGQKEVQNRRDLHSSWPTKSGRQWHPRPEGGAPLPGPPSIQRFLHLRGLCSTHIQTEPSCHLRRENGRAGQGDIS